MDIGEVKHEAILACHQKNYILISLIISI